MSVTEGQIRDKSHQDTNVNDNDNESNFIAMNYINHNTRDIQARLIDGK